MFTMFTSCLTQCVFSHIFSAPQASRGGPKVVADAKGVKSVESAHGSIGLEAPQQFTMIDSIDC